MSDVSVSLKLTPTEFDLIRKCLVLSEREFDRLKREEREPRQKTEYMQTLAQLQDLQRKLK